MTLSDETRSQREWGQGDDHRVKPRQPDQLPEQGQWPLDPDSGDNCSTTCTTEVRRHKGCISGVLGKKKHYYILIFTASPKPFIITTCSSY